MPTNKRGIWNVGLSFCFALWINNTYKWDVFFRKMKNLNRLDNFFVCLHACICSCFFVRAPTLCECACLRCLGAMQKPNMNNILSYLSTKPNDLFMGPFAVRTQNIWIIQLVSLANAGVDVKRGQQATNVSSNKIVKRHMAGWYAYANKHCLFLLLPNINLIDFWCNMLTSSSNAFSGHWIANEIQTPAEKLL